MAAANSARRIWFLGLLAVLAGSTGLAILSLVPFETFKPLADRLAPRGEMPGFTPDLFGHLRSNGMGIALVIAGLGAMVFAHPLAVAIFLEALGQDWKNLLLDLRISAKARFGHPIRAASLGGILLAGLVLRLSALTLPIKNDEATSYVSVAAHSLRMVLFNDWSKYHAFNNLMVWLATRLGGDAEWVIRSPVFLAGMAVIVLTFWLGASLFSPAAGLFGAAIMAVAWPMVEYSANARGYMLGTAFLLMALHLLDYASRRDNRAAWLGGALAAALCAYCVSTMVISLLAVALWLGAVMMAERRQSLTVTARRAALAATVCLLATLGLYLTFWIGSGPLDLARPPLYALPPPSATLAGALSVFVDSFLDLAGFLLPRPVAAGFGALVALGACRDRRAGLLALSLPLAVIIFLVASRYSTPPARVYVPLLPLLGLLAGHGLDGLALRVAPNGRPFLALCALGFLGLAAWAATRPPAPMLSGLGAFPEAPAASRALLERLRPGEAAIGDGVGIHIAYYLARQGHSQGRILRERTVPASDQPMVHDCLDPACAQLPRGYVHVALKDGAPVSEALAGLAIRETTTLSRLIDSPRGVQK